MIASCGPGVKIHEWPSGNLLFDISAEDKPDEYTSISWSTKGQRLLAIPVADKPIMLTCYQYKTQTNFDEDILQIPVEATVVAFSRKSEGKATFATANGEMVVMDVFTRETLKHLQKLSSGVNFLDYGYKDILLAVGSTTGQVYIYNANGAARSNFYVPWSYTLSAMMCHPWRENLLAAGSKEGVLSIWDIYSNTVKFAVKNHTGPVNGIMISSPDELVTSVGVDKKINMYDLRTKETVFSKNLTLELSAVACAPLGQDFAVATTAGRILILDKRQPSRTKGSFVAQNGLIKSLSFDTNTLDDRSTHNLHMNLSTPIPPDEQGSTTEATDSDPRTKASGDFSDGEEESPKTRIPAGLDGRAVDIYSGNAWHMPQCVIDTSLFLSSQPNMCVIKEELINASFLITQKFMEDLTNQFLQVRMGVSRELCHMETSNNKRWRQFNTTLLNLAGYDDSRKELDVESNILSRSDDSAKVSSKRNASYMKTKIGDYSQRKVPSIVELGRRCPL